jgi:hypothetical protein
VLGLGPGRYPQTSRTRTIPLPDNVLLEIFNFYLDQDDRVDAWHTLVHVCQQWRRVVFASPRRLKLQLLCTPKRPVSITLKIWPALPIAIAFVVTNKRPRGMANITGSLKQHDRVYKISIRNIPNSLLKIFGAMKNSFSTLTELKLSSRDENALVARRCDRSGWLEFHYRHHGKYSCLPVTLSTSAFGKFPIPDTLHPRRWSPPCPH